MSVLFSTVAVVAGVLIALVAITPFVDRRRQTILRRCLHDVSGVLNEHGVDYWCDFGTLLGFYREHDIILTDYDVDLCMMDSERPKVVGLADAFKARGYRFRDADESKLVIRIFDNRSRYYVDLYRYRPEGAWLRSAYRSEEDVPAALVADRVSAPFLGGAVRVPRDTEALLLHRYGPGWRTPRRGDQGTAYGFSRLESFVRLLENNFVGIWSLLKAR